MDQEKKMIKQNKILFASKSTFLVFIIFFIFSGCGLKQESLSINHYGIDFKTQKKAEVSKLKSILIEEVNVNRSFNLTSIFYSTKPYLFEEYAQNRWINLPSNMIYNQLTDSFITSNIFEKVYRQAGTYTPVHLTIDGKKKIAMIGRKAGQIDRFSVE